MTAWVANSLVVGDELAVADVTALLAALCAGIAAAAGAFCLVPPTAPLAPRVRPYAVVARTRLGRSADIVTRTEAEALPGGVMWRLWGPPLRAVLQRLRRFRAAEADAILERKLRQAGYAVTVEEFRLRHLAQTASWAAASGAGGYAVMKNPAWMLLFGAGGFLFGFSRLRSRLARALEVRRSRMRIELYTINMQLAMHVRTAPGLVKHVERLVRRGRGEVVAELRDVLNAVRSGASVPEAFGRAAELTPEPWAARTYKLLGIADERGADLAGGLLALSEDIRDSRREDMRRAAVRRTGAMLLPTIGLLAPTMLLFIAAPLPRLVFGVG